MNTALQSCGSRWLSFHVFLPSGFNSFLLDYFLPVLEEWLDSGVIKRFFFIRYSENGHHLRLRFQPKFGTESAMLEERLAGLVRKFAAEAGGDLELCSLQRHQYDRAELYFGETIQSVYAELLNQQTSYLCLRLLRARSSSDLRLMMIVTATLAFILRRCENDLQDYIIALDDSRAFAIRGLQKLGYDTTLLSGREQTAFHQVIVQAIPQVAVNINEDPMIHRIIRLLRRTRKGVPSGRNVAAHALHLFCNKMGLSFLEEFELFDTLHNVVINQSVDLGGHDELLA